MDAQPVCAQSHYAPSRQLQYCKLYDARSEGPHPSEIPLRHFEPRFILPQFLNSTHSPAHLTGSHPAGIMEDTDLQNLYNATMDFLSDRSDGECTCLNGAACLPGLPGEQFLNARATDSPSHEDAVWPSIFETLDEYISSDSFEVDFGAASDPDAVQEISNPASVRSQKPTLGTPQPGAYFDNVTMQMTGYTALDMLKEPSPEGSHLERRQMHNYTALDQVCSVDKSGVSIGNKADSTNNSFALEFFKFPEPAFSHDFSGATLELDMAKNVLDNEELDKRNTKPRDTSPAENFTNMGVGKPPMLQLQVEYDAISDELTCVLEYEFAYDSYCSKRRARVSSRGLVPLPTIKEEEEPNLAVSNLSVTTSLSSFLAPNGEDPEESLLQWAGSVREIGSPGRCSGEGPSITQCAASCDVKDDRPTVDNLDRVFTDGIWCSSPSTELKVPSDPILARTTQLPGQTFPQPDLLNGFSTGIDGLLSTMFEQIEAGNWDGLPTLGCDLQCTLRALCNDYPVFGVMERLGAAVGILLESVAALESVRMDLLGDECSA